MPFGIQPGLCGVVHRQGETMLWDAESMMILESTSGFIRVSWGGGLGVVDTTLSLTVSEIHQD